MRIQILTGLAAIMLAIGPALPAGAFLQGDGKGKPERDCYVGMDGYSQEATNRKAWAPSKTDRRSVRLMNVPPR